MKFFESLGEWLAMYLKSNRSWEHTHNESIGEVELKNPWREDVWHHKTSKWHIRHWQNLKHAPYMSGPTPRHVWHLTCESNEAWQLSLQYGVAPNE